MAALPLITRNPYQLVLLSPGTSQTDSGNGGISVNGARDRNNNFMLDGVDNNDTSVPGGMGGVLNANPESTEEFRVITDNFDAEYGRNTGAIIDVVTKSGTNSLHGNVYYFGRWNGFGGARDYFNPGCRTRRGADEPLYSSPVRILHWRSRHQEQDILFLQRRDGPLPHDFDRLKLPCQHRRF